MLTIFLFVALTTITVQGDSIVSIASGTGYRSCSGYCYQTLNISESTITTSKTSETDPDNYPEIRQDYPVESSEFNQLVELVGDIQQWKGVDSPIGCPDCDNQGSEWIDIYTDEQPKYGVTFEHDSTIPGYESLVERLRTIREQYFPSGGTSD